MKRAIIGYQNRIDGATLSGGDWQAPLTHIQNQRLAIRARSADTANASTLFDIDFGTPQTIEIIGMTAHNISLDGRWRVTAGSGAGLADVYDSGWVISFPSVYASMSLAWEDPNFWFGKLTEEERQGYTVCNAIEVATSRVRYWRIEIDDIGNADGFIEVGRVFIGRNFSPSKGFKVGATIGYNDDSDVMRSLLGTEYFNRVPLSRTATLTAPVMNKPEAFSRVFEMMRLSGVTQEVMLIGDPDDAGEMLRQSFIGRLERLSPISQESYALNSVGFQIKEII